MSVRSNISLSTSTPSTVCTARLGLPMSALYIAANRSSSISGRASFRNTCAQLLRISLAFLGVIRNSDCHKLS